jgi:hypothetical protein
MIQSLWDGPVVDDEAASGAPEHSLSGRSQTSHERLAITRQAVVQPVLLKIAQPFMAGNHAIQITKSRQGRQKIFFRP